MHFVASDFDGTLLINNEVKKSDIEAIKEFRKNGNIFSICTGRPINSVLTELKKYQVPFDYIIGVNGAIATNQKIEVMYSHELDSRTVHLIQDILSKHNVKEYMLSNGIDQARIIGEQNINKLDVDVNQVRGYYVDTYNPESAFKLAAQINAELGDDGITAYPNNQYVAIGMSGIHKGHGVDRLTKLIGFNGGIHVIGDDYNDIPMFKRYDSYGIKSGVVDAISFAKNQTNSVSDVLSNLK
ncbi:HAD-IIB family hydrolase [Haploplasma axanthum]|uniref:Sugar phosphate phosphatase n=1 Tax=Haploplasma axanthum TaxID=29552 RepID=A0A449BFN1_HAPAX|nr:HAD-IIB family hydrolase [Haploplasma axanthum]VEU81254.1 sugar phosphate phosphatase [Haploplasma axanthum]